MLNAYYWLKPFSMQQEKQNPITIIIGLSDRDTYVAVELKRRDT